MLDSLLEITIFSTVLFAVTMLIKRLLNQRISPFLHYAIWSLFLLRLMLPFTLQSPIHVFTLPPAQAAAPATADLTQQTAIPAHNESQASETLAETANAAMQSEQTSPPQLGFVPIPQASVRTLSLSEIILFVWLTGAVAGIGYAAFLYIRLQRRISRHAARPSRRLRSLYAEVRRELGIRQNVPLVCQYGLTSPGILFPARVLMPMDLLVYMDDEQIKSTLRHELVHYKRKDHIVSILLTLLNAVYWFHPVVWFAVRQIRADMETACDSAVVEGMSAAQKGAYASLVLDLFSRSNYQQVVLGMAYGKTKSVVEKRIKGVFMQKNSYTGAKVTCALISLVLCIGCFTTACVPAKSVAIIGGSDGPTQIDLTDSTLDSPDPTPTPAPAIISPLAQVLGVPDAWTFSEWSSDKKLFVTGNPDVTLPDTAALPVASAHFRDVTKEDLSRAITAFFGQEVSFTAAYEDTREYAQNSLPLMESIYENILNGTSPNKDPEYEQSVKDKIETYTKMLETAPSLADKTPIPLMFSTRSDESGNPTSGFRGVSEYQGVSYRVSASNSERANTIVIAEVVDHNPLYYLGTYRTTPDGIRTTKEQAVAQAAQMAVALDPDLTLSHVMTVGLFVNQGETSDYAHPWAWQCVFMRNVNGVDTVYDSRDVGTDIDTNVVTGRVNEALYVTVDDRGICNVRWFNPMTVDTINESSAALLPFSEIEAMLPDLIREKYDYDVTREEGALTLYLQHVQLGMMRVGKPGQSSYTLEPVWSFFIGFEEEPDYSAIPDLLNASFRGDPAYWNSLTISAIDGREIDRDRGY